VLEAGTIIAVGESQAFNYEVTFIKPIPPQARELRNIIEVKVAGREKVFHDIVGFGPYGYVELEDTAPPEISVTGVSDGDVITSPDTVTISFTVTDDKDPSPTVNATLNGDLIEPGEEVEVSKVGEHKLVVKAEDASGNKAEEEIEFEIVEA